MKQKQLYWYAALSAIVTGLGIGVIDDFVDHSFEHARTFAHMGPLMIASGMLGACWALIWWKQSEVSRGDAQEKEQ